LSRKILIVYMKKSSTHSLLVVIIALFCFSCGAQAPKIKYPGEVNVAQMVGYFANTLPCEDCPGVFTEIQFYADSTFLMYELFYDIDEIPKGTFGRWADHGRVIKMDLMKGETRNLLYNGKDMLLLDDNEEVIEDDIKYAILRQRPGESIKLGKTFKVIAEYRYEAEAAALIMCNINHTFPVMNMNAYEDAKIQYENRKIKNKPCIMELNIHIEELPLTSNAATIYLAIDRVREILNIHACPD
jgi:copper homeostasis protein (lipoprotein)